MSRIATGFGGQFVITAFMPNGYLCSVGSLIAACVLVIWDGYRRQQ